MAYFVYILESQKDGRYYVGSIYSEEHPDRSRAAGHANEIKAHKRRAFNEELIGRFSP